MAFAKIIVPVLGIFLLGRTGCTPVVSGIIMLILVYDLGDTVTYLLALMFLSDVQRPSANVIRSLVMLVINYIEVQLDMAAVYLSACNLIQRTTPSVECAIKFIIDSSQIDDSMWLKYANNGLKFFFLTVALSYFSNHMRMRKFRTV